MKEIGFIDYVRMFKKRGIKLPIKYFLENHLFDILNKTDTHRWLPKEDFDVRSQNISHGILYMASWTNVIKKSTNYAINSVKNLSEYDFIDVGSGKGKTVLVWLQMQNVNKKISIYGVEYSKKLVEISKINIKKIKCKNKVKFLNIDVVDIDPQDFKSKILLYLYNPFDEIILRKLLDKFKNKQLVIIYNNPVHEYVMNEFNLEKIYSEQGWHQNSSFNIYKSMKF